MSLRLAAVAMSNSPVEYEGQLEVDQDGAVEQSELQQFGVSSDMHPSNQSGFVTLRDTSSIPGISMYARQWYPSVYFTHAELVANKEIFFEALDKFHNVLGTRLTKKGRKGKERAAEVRTFQESIAGIPPLGGVAIDLHLLYVEVTSRGGLEKVIKDRKWREVINIFEFPEAITSGSYMLRKYYVGLLYYFEQAYFFGKQGPLVPPPMWMPGPLKKSVYSVSREYPLSDAEPPTKSIRKRKILPMQIMPVLDPALSIGMKVQGAIKGKFEQGYLVTVTVGTEVLQGVLYHVPPIQKTSQHADVPNYDEPFGAEMAIPRAEPKPIGSWRKRRRRDERVKRDPNAPRPNKTGYNFFFADQSSKFKAMYPDADKELGRIMGHAWNSLTDEEKLPYREQSMKDKVRYTTELQEYRERLQANKRSAPVEPATISVQENEAAEEESAVDADDGPKDIVKISASNATSDEAPQCIAMKTDDI